MKTVTRDIFFWTFFLIVGFAVGFTIAEFNQRNRETATFADEVWRSIPFVVGYEEEP